MHATENLEDIKRLFKASNYCFRLLVCALCRPMIGSGGNTIDESSEVYMST